MDQELKRFLYELGAAAEEQGLEAYIVGGYVRETIFNKLNPHKDTKEPRDVDLVVNTDAIKFIQHFQKGRNGFEITDTYPPFATAKIKVNLLEAFDIEIASARTETYSEPAAFPKVQLTNSIKEDLPRRDFTINSLLISILPSSFGDIADFTGGVADINNGVLKAFHKKSFIDDPTRIVRAIRFAAVYDLDIESHTDLWIATAIRDAKFADWVIQRKNRFKIELDHIQTLPMAQLSTAFQLMKEYGLDQVNI